MEKLKGAFSRILLPLYYLKTKYSSLRFFNFLSVTLSFIFSASVRYSLSRLCIFLIYSIVLLSIAVLIYYQLYHYIMPEILQSSELSLYSEPTHKESLIILGESINLEEPRYNIYCALVVPETSVNSLIPGVNIELWANKELIGKGYKSIKKHENFGSASKKHLQDLGVLIGLYDDVQKILVKIPVTVNTYSESITVKIFPSELQIEAAEVAFEVKLTGIKLFLYDHFSIAFMFGILWIITIELFIGLMLNNKKKTT